MLRLSPHALERIEISIESLYTAFALFVRDRATAVNGIKEQRLLHDMMQRGEDQKILSAWSAQIAKQRKDWLGAR
jgi:hypothetical protein